MPQFDQGTPGQPGSISCQAQLKIWKAGMVWGSCPVFLTKVVWALHSVLAIGLGVQILCIRSKTDIKLSASRFIVSSRLVTEGVSLDAGSVLVASPVSPILQVCTMLPQRLGIRSFRSTARHR